MLILKMSIMKLEHQRQGVLLIASSSLIKPLMEPLIRKNIRFKFHYILRKSSTSPFDSVLFYDKVT